MRNKFIDKIFTSAILAVGALVFVAFAGSAHAMTPTVVASATGSGDNVLLSVTGDPSANVILNYLSSGSSVQMTALGTTNSGGSFSTTISTSAYGISPGSLFNVAVNSQSSVSQTWPYATSTTSSGNLSLSQTSLTIAVGQATQLSVSNNNGSAVYLSSNSNPSISNISVNGNLITVTANTPGTTTASVCMLLNTTNCASFTVTVPGTTTAALTFSQNNVTVAYGQNISVTIAGGTGSYSISSNSNPSVIQAVINGTALSLYASSNTGTATITVCSSNMASCGVVTVTASTVSSVSALNFSQSNVSMAPGQVTPVTVSGGSGSYYVSSNTNTASVQTTLVGSNLSISGNSNGSAVLTICSSAGGCGTINVTVANPGTTSIALGQTNVTLVTGQVINVSITGAGSFSVFSNSAPSVGTATISGNNVVVTALTAGTASIVVCQSGGQCAALYLTVTASTTGSAFTINPASVNVAVGQTATAYLSGGSGYYISSNSNNSVASVLISGSTVSVVGIVAGSTSATICQSYGQCAVLSVTVGGATTGTTMMLTQVISVGQSINLMVAGGSRPYTLSSNSGTVFGAVVTGNVLTLTGIGAGMSQVNVCSAENLCATVNIAVVGAGTSSGAVSPSNAYKFKSYLIIGSVGAEVTELQNKLKTEGFFSGEATGRFGAQTEAAVKKYQAKHGLSQLGVVGPGTRAELNK